MSTPRYLRPHRKKGLLAAARIQRRSDQFTRLEFRVDPFIRRVVRPFLISLMATSVAIAMLVVVGILYPEEAWLAIAVLTFFAALEGAYTAVWLDHPNSRAIDRTLYRVAEVFVLVVIARIFSLIFFGDGIPGRAEIQTYLGSPMSFFFADNFFTTAIVMLAGWWFSVMVSRIFNQLDLSEEEIRFFTLPESQQKLQADDRPIQIARSELENNYLTIFLAVGMALVVMVAISTYEVREFATVANPFEFTRLGIRPAMLVALMLYFLCGLWLLSHSRLLRMNARWLMDGVAMEPELERVWQRASLFLILTIALVAAFLPIGSTLAISQILMVIVQGLYYLIGLIYGLFGLIFASMLMFLSRNAEPGEQQPMQPLPTQPPPPPPEQLPPPNPIIGYVVSSAFWALLIALILAAMVYVLKERGYRLDTSLIRSYYSSVSLWLNDLFKRLRYRARVVRRNVYLRLNTRTNSVAPHNAISSPRRRFLRINALSPREQIQFFYLSMVKRASEGGIKRQENETPLEYVEDLKEFWPELDADLEDLTDAFLEARYNDKPIEKTAVHPVKEGWKRVKSRLRSRRGAA